MTVARPARTDAIPDVLNEARLRGRLAGHPQSRELPSGDVVVLLRVVVPRQPRSGRASTAGRSRVDTLDCAVWRADLRRKVRAWVDGDQVEVVGAVRRRFWRTPAGAVSRYEIEAAGLRRLRRASVTM